MGQLEPKRTLPGLLFALAAAALLLWALKSPARVYGDGGEYFLMLESFVDHGTPEYQLGQARWTADAFGWEHPVSDQGLPAGYVPGKSPGESHSIHFWAYSLAATPVRLALGLLGQRQSASFQVLNALLLLGALFVVVFRMRAPPRSRLLFAALATATPVLWYLPWPHPEVYSWAFTLLALVALHARRYPAAAAAAAVAALQNPPLAFLALWACGRALRERPLGEAARTLGAGALALLPPAYYLFSTGHASPIVATGTAGLSQVSSARLWSFVADLNQGLLPYVPLLLLPALVSVAHALRRRDIEALGLAATLLAMMTAATATANWNAGCAGLLRYAVWTLPLWAYLAVFHAPPVRRLTQPLWAGVALHAAVVVLDWRRVARRESWVEQAPLAAFVLARAPRLYDPDPEIFAERQLGFGWAGLTLANDPRPSCPITFEDRDGVVTKLLTDAASLPRLVDCHVVEPGVLAELVRAHGARRGLFYIEPARGSIVENESLPADVLRLCREKIVRNRAVFVSKRGGPDDRGPVVVRLRNAGTSTWSPGRFRLAPRDGAGLPFAELSAPVPPGQTHAFELSLSARQAASAPSFQMQEVGRERFDEATPPLELSRSGDETIDLLADAEALEGFHGLERDAGGSWRWTSGEGLVHFSSPSRADCRLEADLDAPLGVELLLDQRLLGREPTRNVHPLGDGLLRAGRHTLTLRSPTFVPALSGQSADGRRLGVAVRRLEVSCGASP